VPVDVVQAAIGVDGYEIWGCAHMAPVLGV
jgi:hypothetical protein